MCGWWWWSVLWYVGDSYLGLTDVSVDEDSWESFRLQTVHPKGNQAWTFIERTVVEAKAPIVWPPDTKNWLTGKDSEAGKDWQLQRGHRGWDG